MSVAPAAIAARERGELLVRARPFLWAGAGGVLHCLAFLGFGVWPLALVSLVPLWRALEEVRGGGAGRAAGVGLAFGWIAYLGGYHWMWRLVEVFLAGELFVGAAFWLAHSLWFGLRFALYGVLYQQARARGWPVALAAVPPLLAIEWLYPALFPVHAGAALVGHGAWVQIAALGGPLLLTALVAVENVAVFETWRWLRKERPRPLAAWTLAGLAAAGAWGYGVAHAARMEARIAEAPSLRVGVVQANLGLIEKRRAAVRVHRRHLEQTRTLLADGPLDLVIWPETAYIRGLRRPLPISGAMVREDLRVPLLFGGASVRTDSGRRLRYNSALLVGADGVIRDAYDKNLLVPFAEYLPFSDLVPGLAGLFPNVQRFQAASDTPSLSIGPWRISTPICYEDVRPDFVRRMVREADPHLIVSLANDAWFGDSQEPWIHLALVRLRAIEEARYVVRATNSGPSAVVDPLGRLVARTGLLAPASLRSVVRPLSGRTVYARFGDWPGALGLLSTGLVLALRRRPRPAGPAQGTAR